MSKQKKHTIDTRAIARRAAWEAARADLSEGRRLRAATFTDRRKEANRTACRGKIRHDA